MNDCIVYAGFVVNSVPCPLEGSRLLGEGEEGSYQVCIVCVLQTKKKATSTIIFGSCIGSIYIVYNAAVFQLHVITPTASIYLQTLSFYSQTHHDTTSWQQATDQTGHTHIPVRQEQTAAVLAVEIIDSGHTCSSRRVAPNTALRHTAQQAATAQHSTPSSTSCRPSKRFHATTTSQLSHRPTSSLSKDVLCR